MKPLVGITCDTVITEPHVYFSAGEKYCQAITDCTDAIPILMPVMPHIQHDLLDRLDGLLITGGYSNIQRHHYQMTSAPDSELEDPKRDSFDLSIIPKAVKIGLPVFGICRGLQAMNVAFGGSLYPAVHDVSGRLDHRENKHDPLEKQYGPAHSVTCTQDGLLQSITQQQNFMVNSVHGQAIRKTGRTIQVEATAEDKTIEAISVTNAKGFALAVQWHPEYQAKNNAISVKLFQAFNQAVTSYAALKQKDRTYLDPVR